MDTISYPHSESEGEHPPLTDSDGDVRDLVSIAVEKEILRGNQLRAEKVKQSPREQSRDYDIINIEVLKPVCPDEKRYYRKSSPNKFKGFLKGSGSPSTATPRPNSPNSRNYYPSQDMNPNSSKKTHQRCPLRIAELAVPTKRQCIETWRAKCHTLPGYMVDRLRRQVMDQTPVVGIPEAIKSFKKRKNDPVKRPCKKISASNEDQNMKEIKGLCGIFGVQISKLLMIPMCITLNPRLSKLSDIIAGDMNQLIKTSKKFEMDKSMYYKILNEMSSKVALWIVNILEDASYKLLEQDIRVKRNTYRKLGKEDKLVTLIEKTFGIGVMSDLEEEEGPVLDFIDDLVENVVSFCEPPMDIDEFYGSSPDGSGSYERKLMYKDYEKSIDSPNSTQNMDFDSYSSDQNDTTVYDTGESLTHYKSAIEHELRDSPTTQSFNTNDFQSGTDDKMMNKLEEVEEENFSENIRDNITSILDIIVMDVMCEKDVQIQEDKDEQYEDSYDLDTMPTSPFKDVVDTTHIDILDETTGSNEINTPLINETNTTLEIQDENVNNIDESNINVSANIEIVTGEFLDVKNKKVNFSNNIVTTEGHVLIENSRSHEVEDNLKAPERISWKPSIEYIKPDVIFGPPNQDLLSNADELWPEDIISPMLKTTDSVSKSITSLGRIYERDEMAPPSPEITSPNHNTDTDAENILENNSIQIFQDVDEPSAAVEITITDIDIKGSPITMGSEININKKVMQHKDESTMAEINNNVNIVTKPLTVDSEINTNQIVTYSKDESSTTDEINNICDNVMKSDMVDYPIVKDTKVDQQTEYEINETNVEISQSKTGQLTCVHSETFEYKLDTAIEILSTQDQEFSLDRSQSYENVVVGVVRDKIKLSRVLTEVKLSYKVHPNSAPSWVSRGHGEPSDDSYCSEAKGNILHDYYNWKHDQARTLFIDKRTMKEADYSQWCKDLDQGFKNIDMWNNWISDMCHNVMYVESRNGLAIPQKTIMKHWLQLKKNIDKDTILWRKLNQRAYNRLKMYRNTAKKSQSSISGGDNKSLTGSNEVRPEYSNVLDRIYSFDRLCGLMHRQVGSIFF